MLEAAAVTWCLWENVQLRAPRFSKIVVVSEVLSVGWESGTSSSAVDPVSLREAVPKDYKPFACCAGWEGKSSCKDFIELVVED